MPYGIEFLSFIVAAFLIPVGSGIPLTPASHASRLRVPLFQTGAKSRAPGRRRMRDGSQRLSVSNVTRWPRPAGRSRSSSGISRL